MAATKQAGDALIDALKKATNGLEQFQVKLALGKAEAKDKFEELKTDFKKVVQKAKTNIARVHPYIDEFKADVEHLQVQLALGKAETKDAFDAQKKKIVAAINRFEKRLQELPRLTAADEAIRHELELFRMKLEVLQLHYHLGMMEAKDEFEKRKKEFSDRIAKLKAERAAAKKVAAADIEARKKELKRAYAHVKKAFGPQ